MTACGRKGKTMNTILLCEDNPHIMKINRSALVMENYRVIEAADAASCREALRRDDVDLIILDVMLPDGDGIALCREIKKMYDVPVLFLSALGENEDVIAALRAGGDDYLPKPYDIRVLLARVEARLRSANKDKRFVCFGNVRLDTVSMIAYNGERDLLLTHKEFAILLMLGRNAGRTVTKEELYENVWGNPIAGNGNALYTAVSRLNKKLGDSGADITVSYRRNIGYTLGDV